MHALRSLIVEDEVITALSLRIELEQHGYEVVGSATSGQSAVEMAGSTTPDVVIMDIHLDGSIDGIQAAETIRERWGIPVLFFTGFDIEPLQAR
jgi:CheY-like chemotaxis protein